MKIGLYFEHGDGNGVGGAELMMAYLAAQWARTHEVDLIHHRLTLTRERILKFLGDESAPVRLRYVPRASDPLPHANPLARYGAAREWNRDVSEGYDLFVNCTHWMPSFCRASVGALLVLFPFYVRPQDAPEMKALPRWKQLRHRLYYDLEWNRRMATYRHRLAISAFTRDWTRRRWGVDCTVVHPPVEVQFASVPKDPLVLSVGRFSTKAHTKRQLEMMQAFRELAERAPAAGGWRYASVGGLNDRDENRVYFERVREAGRGLPALVSANLERPAVCDLLQRARIFWHATGLDVDTESRPELAEHFGIATVEAMAAGAVPVVIAKGGQPEIVVHGESGFLWHTLGEMKAYTLRLMENPDLWERMSAAARARAQQFGRERFLQQVSTLLGVSCGAQAGATGGAPGASRGVERYSRT